MAACKSSLYFGFIIIISGPLEGGRYVTFGTDVKRKHRFILRKIHYLLVGS
jgi:hypothetical protein